MKPIACGVVLLLVLGIGCGRQRSKQPLIDGFLFREAYIGYPVSYDRWIEVYDEDGLPQIPTAKYNGQQLEMVHWNPFHTIYEDTFRFRRDTVYELRVEHYWGTATTRVNMPADFRITCPDSNYVYNRDSVLTINWQRSRGASWYWVVVYLGYYYQDTSGRTRLYQDVKDTILTETTCVFAANRFFPPTVREVIQGEGAVVMWAADGPQTVQGALGNVQGAGYGYVSAANQPEEVYFAIARRPQEWMNRAELGRKKRNEFVQRLRSMTGIKEDPAPGRRRPGERGER